MTREDLELFFEDPHADRSTWHSYEQVEKGHGRLERRHLLTSPDLNELLDREWGEVGQVFRLQRERKTAEKRSVEVVYGLTTLSREQCSIQRLFRLIRDHWAVENRLHGRRDVTLEKTMWRSRSSCRSNACRTQLARALLDGYASGFQCGSSNPAICISPEEALAWLL
ncbi:hypothetical protein [Dictyobacter vulcani]|uniref:hypothetical protein n=1 Tax=Dictyobacter vulcani TaxID=2607529 RepID=UPI001E4A15A1|nr:hypothetical protein [Dictyobacter vulcani]